MLSLLTSEMLFERDGLVYFNGEGSLSVRERPRSNSLSDVRIKNRR